MTKLATRVQQLKADNERRYYLTGIAQEHGVTLGTVELLADILGDDYDAVVKTLKEGIF